jgi:hypothetical protein
VWFRNREAGLMYLDRDDRGISNNTVEINGRTVVNPIRQEVVTLRGIVPGEYIVNAHYYDGHKDRPATISARLGQPVEVTLTVVKVNPRAEVVFYGQHALGKPGDEATLVRFTVRADGSVADLGTLAKPLARR